MTGHELPRPGAPDATHPVCAPDDTGHCSVCGDEGLVGTVVELADGGRTARILLDRESRGRERVDAALDLLEGVEPGDRLVVHMGFAIAAVREDS